LPLFLDEDRPATAALERCLGDMHTLHRPRWPEGSTPRLVHAVAVWLALGVLVIASRFVLVPGLGRPIAFALVLAGVAAIIGGLMIRVGRLRARDLGLTLAGWPRELALGAAGLLAISALLVGWTAIADGGAEAGALVDQIASYSAGQRVGFLVTGLVAATVEELVFRGNLQPSLIARLGTAGGLLATMVLFQVGHYTDWPTPSRVGGLAILGLGFGLLRGRDRPLLAAFTAHTLVWVVWGNG
jgi:membrane protease YdiL (CAAX protease family)